MEFLTKKELISLVSNSMSAPPNYWAQIVLYKPLEALMSIMPLNYLLIDEPNIKLSPQNYKIITSFSTQNPDFIFFRNVENDERAKIIEIFIEQLHNQQYKNDWQKQKINILVDWRPYAIENFFIDKIEEWENFRNNYFEAEIINTLQDNHLDIAKLCYYNLYE